jgi:lipopolysaccharide heptosyltransferase II
MPTPLLYNHILIVNTFGIGDVLFTTPLIESLKANNPGCRISYLANRRTETFLRHNPHIDRIFIYERDEFEAERKRSWPRFWMKWRDFLKTIRAERYDTVLDLSMNASLNFLLAFSGAKQRIGFNYKNRGRWLTHPIVLKRYEGRHVAEYYQDLLIAMGVEPSVKDLKMYWPPEDTQWVNAFWARHDLHKAQSVVALIPGGGASWGKDAGLKRWSPENFAKLADYLVENHGAVIILVGDTSEAPLCHQVAGLMRRPCLNAAGQTTVTQFAALTRQCRLVIANDGGPLHIAVAAGAKTASIFGPVDSEVYGPYPPDKHIVITNNIACQPCYRNFRMTDCQHRSCLRDLTLEDVIRKVEPHI